MWDLLKSVEEKTLDLGSESLPPPFPPPPPATRRDDRRSRSPPKRDERKRSRSRDRSRERDSRRTNTYARSRSRSGDRRRDDERRVGRGGRGGRSDQDFRRRDEYDDWDRDRNRDGWQGQVGGRLDAPLDDRRDPRAVSAVLHLVRTVWPSCFSVYARLLVCMRACVPSFASCVPTLPVHHYFSDLIYMSFSGLNCGAAICTLANYVALVDASGAKSRSATASVASTGGPRACGGSAARCLWHAI